MTRRVRRVPPDWNHPKDARGLYIPLLDGALFVERVRRWDEGAAKWREGLQRDLESGEWQPIDAEWRTMTYAECRGDRPEPKDYMPQWPAAMRTHWQMYEQVSDGTPISPVCSSPEELARWLTDHKADAFAGTTASYEAWLYVARGGISATCAVTTSDVVADFVVCASHAQGQGEET